MGSVYPDIRYIRRNKQIEQSIQQQVCSYLRKEYPHIMFRTDGGGLKLSKTQAIQYARGQSHNGWPDLFLPYPSRGYHGLYLELKKDGTAIYLTRGKNAGKLVGNEHIKNQAYILTRLNHLNYFARFAVGTKKAIDIIDWYLEKPKNLTIF